VRELAAIVRRERPQLVLSWLPRAHVYLSPATALARSRSPVAWWQHHTGAGEEALWRTATAIPAAGIVCTSHAVAALQARLRPRRRLLVCHPGVEVPPRPPAEQLAAVRADLGIAPGEQVAALPGRIVAWKGHVRFLEALARLGRQGRRVTGLIVGGGEGDAQKRLGARAQALGVRCVLTGHVEDPSPLMALADVVVNASEEEPFGMTLPEAMALGVPVLAVARGGPAEIVESGVSGLLVADGAPATLAAGLERLLGDDALRATLAAGGQQRYASHFGAEAFAARAAAALSALAQPAR
jgi:glycosyltransferase involved in cell wall biosynthesis